MATEHHFYTPNHHRGGFSFIEVLFAVMILGIGLVLSSGLFVVSSSQLSSTMDETTAAAIAKGAVARVSRSLPWDQMTSTDGAMVPLRLTSAASRQWTTGNAICDYDPRFACVYYIRYEGPDLPAQVGVLVVRNRSGGTYSPADITPPDPASTDPAPLDPTTVNVTLTDGGGSTPDTAEFDSPAAAAIAAPGAYVVIATDRASGESNGHVYRLGSPIGNDGLKWELMPGSDLASADENLSSARALLVGRQRSSTAGGSPTGPAQDVAFYSAMVAPRP